MVSEHIVAHAWNFLILCCFRIFLLFSLHSQIVLHIWSILCFVVIFISWVVFLSATCTASVWCIVFHGLILKSWWWQFHNSSCFNLQLQLSFPPFLHQLMSNSMNRITSIGTSRCNFYLKVMELWGMLMVCSPVHLNIVQSRLNLVSPLLPLKLMNI